MKPIYLDYNATTPLDPQVRQAMLPYLGDNFGNPSSTHPYGTTARKAVEKARQQVAELLGCKPYEIVFTGGGSEANNLAIKGVALAYGEKGNHIVTSAIEHPAVLEVCRYLEARGFRVTYLEVDEHGLVDPQDVAKAITPDTILVTIMHANNEVGTIQPIAEIASITRQRGVLLHSDCAQTVGKIPVNVEELGVDLASIAAHKFYGPKGIGALYVRSGVDLVPIIHGASQEMGLRAGTENVPAIVGLGEACRIVSENLEKHSEHMRSMRERLRQGLSRLDGIRFHGHPEKCLPNTLSVGFRGLEANTILAELTTVAASPGAACHSEGEDISHVLQAMKVPREFAIGTIRFSVGRHTTPQEIDKAIEEISKVVSRLEPKAEVIVTETKPEEIKLTHYTHGLGCACKLRPQVLEAVLAEMPAPIDRNVLVGIDTADDAAVYRIDDTTAIVQTVDFFTPIVDDPYHFGAIAAANSLSDIYAMGGRPLFALAVVGFPSSRLPVEVLQRILEGANAKADEAGIAIVGGHTVDDTEPKFGLAVSGIIDPNRIVTNRGAKPGDVLILTKPIGTGILATALKRGLLDSETEERLVRVMSTLNGSAAEAMQQVGVNACTDITGFGLLGHLYEMVCASGISAQINASEVRLLPKVVELAVGGIVPGGTLNNIEYTKPHVSYQGVAQTIQIVLNDAQTSGGLLIAVPEERAGDLLDALKANHVDEATIVGRILEKGEHLIEVLG